MIINISISKEEGWQKGRKAGWGGEAGPGAWRAIQIIILIMDKEGKRKDGAKELRKEKKLIKNKM